MSDSTAIIFFRRSPKFECRHKKLYAGKDLNIFYQLNHHIEEEIKKTQLDYFISSEETQKGRTFGEKLANEFEKVFDLGFKNVICLGNDSPELDSKLIINASNRMQNGNVVLGPGLDGGVYLIGISKSQFKREEFVKIPWNTSQVFNKLLKSFSKSKVGLLRLLRDLNTKKDFKIWIQSKMNPIISKILMLFFSLRISIINNELVFEEVNINLNLLSRPPPVMVL